MKSCSLLLPLALCLLLTSSCAIRIPRDPNPVESQVNNDEKITNINEGAKACKDNKDCSSTSSGKVRKLMISTNSSPSTPPTTTTTNTSSKSLPKGTNAVDPKMVKDSSSGVASNRTRKTEPANPSLESETTATSSHDTEYDDINEMDYSPAKRKPPIHN